MDRILNIYKKKLVAIIILILLGCGLHVSAQSIVLPGVIDSLTNLETYVGQPFSFDKNTIEEVNIFPGLNATHCKAQSDCGTLPVYLLNFDGKRLDIEHALLYWKTTNEINSKGFQVERALGNTHNFLNQGFVTSLQGGGYEKKYQLKDDNNFPGISYYRLKQIDDDGQFSYSEIVAVKGFSFDDSLLVYPNPAKDYLNVRVYVQKATEGTLTVTDAAGKTIMSKTVNLNAGINFNRLTLANMKAGLYTLKLQRANASTLFKKIIKY